MSEIPDAPHGWPTADPAVMERARTDGGVRALIARAMWRRDYQPGPEANIGGMVYEIADRVAEQVVPEIERQVREQVAAEIEARVAELLTEAARRDEGDRADRLEAIGWYAKADHLGEGARIARGESR